MEKKQTAVNQLLEFIEKMKVKQTLLNGCEIETVHIPSLIHKATELLSVEKSNIVEAGNKCQMTEELPDGLIIYRFTGGEDYYNQTFSSLT